MEEYSVLLVKQYVLLFPREGEVQNSVCVWPWLAVVWGDVCRREPEVVQFSAPVLLCSLHSSCVVPWGACSWAAESGRLTERVRDFRTVAASKFTSSTVGEQVSHEYAKGWCRSKNTHGEVNHAPTHLTVLNFFFLPKLIVFRQYFCYPLMVY